MLSLRLQTTMHRKKFCSSCLNTFGKHCTSTTQKPCAMLSKRLKNTTFRKKSCSMLFLYSWDNVKTLCNVVQEAQDNNAQEKILFNVVLIFLGQHSTCKNLVQCYPRDSRQHCTGKNQVRCRLNITFRQFLFWTG